MAERRNPLLYRAPSLAPLRRVGCKPPAPPSLTTLNEPKILGCPILRALCEGWDVNRPPASFCFSKTNQRTVISTEVVHIVNGEAEKPVSLPGAPSLAPLRRWDVNRQD